MKRPRPEALKAPRTRLLAHARKKIAPEIDVASRGTNQFAHLLPVTRAASAAGSNASESLPLQMVFMTDQRFFNAITNGLGAAGDAAAAMPGATEGRTGIPGSGAGGALGAV